MDRVGGYSKTHGHGGGSSSSGHFRTDFFEVLINKIY